MGFQVLPNNEITDQDLRSRIQATIDRLGLNDNSFRKARADDSEAYKAGEVLLKTLIRHSPFVARELRRQGRLNSDDE